ncbi:MAG TPA: hypothetical protein VNF26_00605 [Candidatus Baltobacterales bacterium]|nr:hypothetical protein [Candidatus Baltobacterales bacterium]
MEPTQAIGSGIKLLVELDEQAHQGGDDGCDVLERKVEFELNGELDGGAPKLEMRCGFGLAFVAPPPTIRGDFL